MKTIKIASAIIAASTVVACGGGGGDGTPAPIALTSGANEVTLLAGTGTAVDGTLETSRYLLKSIGWQVSKVLPTDPDLTLTNQTCDAVTKQDTVEPIMPGAGLGHSTWTCSLGVISKVNVKQDAVYKLLLTGTDSSGQSNTITKQLRVISNSDLSDATGLPKLNIAIVGSLVGKPGQTLSLGALAEWTDATAKTSAPVVYWWNVDAGSQGLAKLLSNTGSNVQLYLSPEQKAPVPVKVTVTATGNGVAAQATMFAMIDPFGPLGPSVSPTVQEVLANSQVCIRARDIDIGDPNLFYQWSVVKIDGVDVVPGTTMVPPLGGANTLNVGFFAPSSPQLLTVRFAVGYQPINPPAIAVNPGTNPYPGVYSVDALVRVTNTLTPNTFDSCVR